MIEIKKDGSEKVKYDYDGYYAYIRRAFLSIYPNFIADSHWHDDIELIYVLSGAMTYNVNGKIIEIESGNGIFVNSRQLHFGYSETKEECDFICILLHPMLLCTSQSIDRSFVAPVISDSSVPYILLNKNIGWHKEALGCVRRIYECRDEQAAPLHIQREFYSLWALFCENLERKERSEAESSSHLLILKEMLTFIQQNYSERTELSDIARSGNVSKSTCLTIFKKYLNDTPTNHLINYRLKKAAVLLAETNMPVSEIALAVGFQSISYFTEVFGRNYGQTPRKYRQNKV